MFNLSVSPCGRLRPNLLVQLRVFVSRVIEDTFILGYIFSHFLHFVCILFLLKIEIVYYRIWCSVLYIILGWIEHNILYYRNISFLVLRSISTFIFDYRIWASKKVILYMQLLTSLLNPVCLSLSSNLGFFL